MEPSLFSRLYHKALVSSFIGYTYGKINKVNSKQAACIFTVSILANDFFYLGAKRAFNVQKKSHKLKIKVLTRTLVTGAALIGLRRFKLMRGVGVGVISLYIF